MGDKQPRHLSAIEASLNVGSGFIVAWLLTIYVLPLWGYEYQFSQTVEITTTYTLVSLVRSYIWRRIFA